MRKGVSQARKGQNILRQLRIQRRFDVDERPLSSVRVVDPPYGERRPAAAHFHVARKQAEGGTNVVDIDVDPGLEVNSAFFHGAGKIVTYARRVSSCIAGNDDATPAAY